MKKSLHPFSTPPLKDVETTLIAVNRLGSRNTTWMSLITASLALAFGAGHAQAQRPLGIDVSSYQGAPNWSSVRGGGVVFAWAKATEGTTFNDADFVFNQNNGKAAGVLMGAYHFARPNQASPGAEAGHFWNVAGAFIQADGRTLMPTLDFEVFSGVVGAGSYSDWANQWCNIVRNDAAGQNVSIRPVIYTSACSACNFDGSVSQWIPWIANYNGQNLYSGNPWSACTSCERWGAGVWDCWQVSSSGAIPGISGNVDLDTFNGNTSQLISVMLATSSCNLSLVGGAIRAKYDSLGDCNSFLGYPTTGELGTPDGVGRYNHFSNDGSIYWTPQTGAWSIHGLIQDHWASLGWETSPLGYPTTDETGTPDGLGRFNHFYNIANGDTGSIYYTAQTGAQSLHGNIRAHWASLGYETSPLGYPTTDETGTPDGLGRYNHFHNLTTGVAGSIYWTPQTGPWAIYGAIQDHWASLGWETSPLGYPTTDENSTPDGIGRYNHFTNLVSGVAGSIYFTPNYGAWAIYGAIHTHWSSLGWETSVLGYPVTDETSTPDGVGRYNHFKNPHLNNQDGSIYWTPSTGAYEVHGPIRTYWANAGWEKSTLGYPTSDQFTVSGSTNLVRNNFQHGTITLNTTTGVVTSP
ncbi:GH25 family lysozyme [Pedosphaera parvula]|uniref:LGFP repeat protein n=1 Tax=Pedosphaera parvula (strain Ellin514) TaxID=320771 RepID=B9XES4_PEDPL|nr:GH25 family lysozyme [Pedosphaera parvula]EEF61788.1 LGFP repeat protein [Pedosphaera parvula Ellin514]